MVYFDGGCNGPPPATRPRPAHLTDTAHQPNYVQACSLGMLRAGWESYNQICFMQHFSSDRRNFPGGHPSYDYSMGSTLNYGVFIHMSSLKRVGQLLKDPRTYIYVLENS